MSGDPVQYVKNLYQQRKISELANLPCDLLKLPLDSEKNTIVHYLARDLDVLTLDRIKNIAIVINVQNSKSETPAHKALKTLLESGIKEHNIIDKLKRLGADLKIADQQGNVITTDKAPVDDMYTSRKSKSEYDIITDFVAKLNQNSTMQGGAVGSDYSDLFTEHGNNDFFFGGDDDDYYNLEGGRRDRKKLSEKEVEEMRKMYEELKDVRTKIVEAVMKNRETNEENAKIIRSVLLIYLGNEDEELRKRENRLKRAKMVLDIAKSKKKLNDMLEKIDMEALKKQMEELEKKGEERKKEREDRMKQRKEKPNTKSTQSRANSSYLTSSDIVFSPGF